MRVHLLALGALCAVTFFIGLTTHGLTNWQEAQRALVARDMARRGDWLVPTVNGEPYLAKPPMIYWAQLGLARLRGAEPGELDLRLTVALAASLGIFCTYFAGRRILASALPAEAGPDGARTAAFWAAAMLGTGILYVRSGRIGELDIVMVPFVVGAVGWVWWGRERAERADGGRGIVGLGIRSLGALPMALPAAVLATGAALTKGPPGVLVIALAAYFPAILLHHGGTEGESEKRKAKSEIGGGESSKFKVQSSNSEGRPFGPVLGALLGLGGAAAATVFISGAPGSVAEGLGVMILAAGLGWLGWVLGRANWGAVVREWSVTHPVVVLGLPMLALLGWGRLVGERIGAEAVARAAGQEASENLQVWVLESPLRTLEGASYGVGLGSIAAIITAIWLVRHRPKLGPGAAVIVGWTIVSLLAFAALGKGPARYLTPVWPGIALAGGLGVALVAGATRKAAGTKRKAKSEKRKFGGEMNGADGRGAAAEAEPAVSGQPAPAAGIFAFRSLFAFDAQTLRIFLAASILLLALGQGVWYGYGREALYAWRSPRGIMGEIMAPEVNPEQARPLALDIWTPALDYYAGGHVQPYFTEGAPSVALAGVRPRPLEALRAELLELEEDGQSPWRIMLVRTTPHPEGPETLPMERLQQAGLMVQTLPPALVASEFRIDNNRTEVVPIRIAPAPF